MAAALRANSSAASNVISYRSPGSDTSALPDSALVLSASARALSASASSFSIFARFFFRAKRPFTTAPTTIPNRPTTLTITSAGILLSRQRDGLRAHGSLQQTELLWWPPSVEQNKRRGASGEDAQGFEVMQFAQRALSAGSEDGVGGFGADTGNA